MRNQAVDVIIRGIGLSVACLCIVSSTLLLIFEQDIARAYTYEPLQFAGVVIFLFALGALIAGKSLITASH